ncbi:hypothetical protein PF008_g13176 [Phytophthora fragariae]|uniref:Uncharacterized protein n=1 Tax=Phytophthora fragariae TaxID=53985 RepID=A0A6G0RLK4_9STRA|nr:hypothetical protein PF008_g13176 [Phytophthora fragariae]
MGTVGAAGGSDTRGAGNTGCVCSLGGADAGASPISTSTASSTSGRAIEAVESWSIISTSAAPLVVTASVVSSPSLSSSANTP